MSEIDDLITEREQLQIAAAEHAAAKEDLLAQAADAGAEQSACNARVAELEQQIGDAQALQELRARGGLDGALAATKIAATMPDPERAAAFEALADELLPAQE